MTVRFAPRTPLRLAATLMLVLAALASDTSARQRGAPEVESGARDDKLELARRIDAILGAYHADSSFDGAALVAMDDEIVFAKGYGPAVREWQIPNGTDTRFRLNAASMPLTAALVLQLAEEGVIELDAPIGRYLPDLASRSYSAATVHHLLSLTSGLTHEGSTPSVWDSAGQKIALADLAERYTSAGPPRFPPGTDDDGNDRNYVLLGAIVESVTSRRFEDLLRERILEPLGMTKTSFAHPTSIVEHAARGYLRILDGYELEKPYDVAGLLSAHGLVSTPRDVFRWVRGLFAGRILSAASLERMLTPVQGDRAYGWHVDSYLRSDGGKGRRALSFGWRGGFEVRVFRLVDDRHTMILMSNAGAAPLTKSAELITELLLGRPVSLPPPASNIPVVFRTVLARPMDEALDRYRALVDADAFMIPGPWAFRPFAEALLRADRVADALRVLDFCDEAFGETWFLLEARGRALEASGQLDGAIGAYRRSLALQPRSDLDATLRRLIDRRARRNPVDPSPEGESTAPPSAIHVRDRDPQAPSGSRRHHR